MTPGTGLRPRHCPGSSRGCYAPGAAPTPGVSPEPPPGAPAGNPPPAPAPAAFRSPEARGGDFQPQENRDIRPGILPDPGHGAGGDGAATRVTLRQLLGPLPDLSLSGQATSPSALSRGSWRGASLPKLLRPAGPTSPLNPGVRAHSWGVIHRGGPASSPASSSSSSSPGAGSGHRPRRARAGPAGPRGFPASGGGPVGASFSGICQEWGDPKVQGTSLGPGTVWRCWGHLWLLGMSVGMGGSVGPGGIQRS